jgi:adenylate kinase family enzyme
LCYNNINENIVIGGINLKYYAAINGNKYTFVNGIYMPDKINSENKDKDIMPFVKKEHLLRYLYCSNMICEIKLDKNMELFEKETNPIFKTNIYSKAKSILFNPQLLTDDLCLKLLEISDLTDKEAAVLIRELAFRGFNKTFYEAIKKYLNKNTAKFLLEIVVRSGQHRKQKYNFSSLSETEKEKIRKQLLIMAMPFINDSLITISEDRNCYEHILTKDKVINLTGLSGAGKSTFAKKHFNNDEYLVVDTDEIFSEKRFKDATGINKELGTMFRNKYKGIPDYTNNFDAIYNDILSYCKQYDKTIVIDCAFIHCITDVNKLIGKVIVLRPSVCTCYERSIKRFKENNPNYSEVDLFEYENKKKNTFKYYQQTNNFIRKINKSTNKDF